MTDKNLGPAIIETQKYIHHALLHLFNKNKYKKLSTTEAAISMNELQDQLSNFFDEFKSDFTDKDNTYMQRSIDACEDFFSYFYMTSKIHKGPDQFRPIVSYSGSLLYSLGKVVDQHLQPIVKKLPSTFKDSFSLKTELLGTPVFNPDEHSLFLCDAKDMFNNIPHDHAFEVIPNFLRNHDLCTDLQNADAIATALELIIRNNMFKFGNLFFQQECGTAMGCPPGTSYANIYIGIFELDLIPHFDNNLRLWRRFVDDGLGLWKHHPCPITDLQNFTDFQTMLHTWGIMEWKVSPFSKSVNYMDLTISLTRTGFHFNIFEKEMNLFLFLIPSSAHPPGVARGTIFGMHHRFFRLCSDHDDVIIAIRNLYRRFRYRGFSNSWLKPVFNAAYKLCFKNRAPRVPISGNRRLIIHLKFNKYDIKRQQIQRLFKTTMLHPPGEPHLSDLENHMEEKIYIDDLTVAYRRPFILKNVLFPRKLRPSIAHLIDDCVQTIQDNGNNWP